MARVKGGQRLMQMSRRGAQPQASSRTMVPGGKADRLRQGRGPVGAPPMAGMDGGGGGQANRPQSGLMKNFGKGLSKLFNKGVTKAGGVLAAGAQLGRQAGEMQRIQGEVEGIAGQIDQATRAKEQFDTHADELSGAIIQNHVESVGIQAMFDEMRKNQEFQAGMRMMQQQARQQAPAPAAKQAGPWADYEVIRGPDGTTMKVPKDNAAPKYPRFEYGEDALKEFDRLIAASKALPKFIQLDDGEGGWRTIDIAKEIPDFAPFVEGSRAEGLRKEIDEGIKRLKQ